MKIVKSLLALVIVIALGVLVYFTIYKSEQTRKVREAKEKQLIRFDLNKIKKFSFVKPDSTIVFERGDNMTWNITSPLTVEADRENIMKLFSSLDREEILYTVVEKTKDFGMYGLDKPSFYMAMEYDESDPDTLFLGAESPDKTMTYIRFASEERILTVSNVLVELMKRPLSYYRTNSMMNVLPEEIASITIDRKDEKGESKVALEFNGLSWNVIEPWNQPADPTNIEELLKKISEFSRKNVEEEKASDLSKYGLDNPRYILTIKYKYDKPERILLVGNAIKEKGRTNLVYAKQFDRDEIFTVEKGVVILLSRVPAWFMEKNPMKFNRDVIDKIVLDTANNPITFVKDAQQTWNVISPIDKNISNESINIIFSITRFLIAHELFAEKPTESQIKETGLDKPRVKISLYENNSLVSEVLFGKSWTTDIQNFYFKTNLAPVIYVTRTNIDSNINNILKEVFGK